MTHYRTFFVHSRSKFVSHRKRWVKLNCLVANGKSSCAVQRLQTKSSYCNLKEICHVRQIQFCSLRLQVSFRKQVGRFHTLS